MAVWDHMRPMADDQGSAVAEDAFALLGHEIRLDILRALFDRYEPIDPTSGPELRDRRTLSYAELMDATGVQDSGKFNYHLEKLRGAYVEAVDGEYVPTAGAIALYEAMIANRPTESVPADVTVEATCPNCDADLHGEYEQEFLTVECPACDIFWGATYRFPKHGVAVREGVDVYEALYDRMMYHVGLARTGQCPSCAGITGVTLPRDRLDGEATPTVEMTCGTCSWLATVDVISALQFEPRVTSALVEIGVPREETSSLRATERVLPAVTGRVESREPFSATVTVPHEGAIAEISVGEGLEVRAVETTTD